MRTKSYEQIIEKINQEIKTPTATTQEVIGLATIAYFCMPFKIAQYGEKIDRAEVFNQSKLLELRNSAIYPSFQRSKEEMGDATTQMIESYIQTHKDTLHVANPNDLRDSGSKYPTEIGWRIKLQANLTESMITKLAIELAYPHYLSVQMYDRTPRIPVVQR